MGKLILLLCLFVTSVAHAKVIFIKQVPSYHLRYSTDFYLDFRVKNSELVVEVKVEDRDDDVYWRIPVNVPELEFVNNRVIYHGATGDVSCGIFKNFLGRYFDLSGDCRLKVEKLKELDPYGNEIDYTRLSFAVTEK